MRFRTERVIGILICGTGIGISIINKWKSVHSAPTASAQATRLHNDANVLAWDVVGPGLAIKIVET